MPDASSKKIDLFTAVSALMFSLLSLTSLIAPGRGVIFRNVFNAGITFAFPLPYMALAACYLWMCASLTRRYGKTAALPAAAMMVILPFIYFLADMAAKMRVIDPFGGNRAFYGLYAKTYFIFFASVLGIANGLFIRRLFAYDRLPPENQSPITKRMYILLSPFVFYFVFAVPLLLLRGCAAEALPMLVFFLAAALFGRTAAVLRAAAGFLGRALRHEKAVLTVIFIAAFLLRFMWGMRLLGITGANFIIASDDGVCYDKFAAILSLGGLIPKEGLFAVSGFLYWHFLAGIYRVFGAHNFNAVVVIQSLLGACVPVLVYLTARNVFGKIWVSLTAAFLACMDMTLIFLSVVIGMEAVYVPLVLLTLFIASGIFGKKEKALFGLTAALGVVMGMAYSARPPELLFFPPVLAVMLFFSGKRAMGAGKALLRAGIFIGLCLSVMSVQYVSNRVNYGESRFMPQAAKDCFDARIAEATSYANENALLGAMGFNPFADAKGAAGVFMNHPGRVSYLLAKGFVKRFFILMLLPNFGVFDPLVLVNPGSGYVFEFPLYAGFFYAVFAVFGIALAFRDRFNPAGAAVLALFMAYISSRVAVFLALNSRYRAALIPLVSIFTACGLVTFFKAAWDVYKRGAGQT